MRPSRYVKDNNLESLGLKIIDTFFSDENAQEVPDFGTLGPVRF